MDLVDLRSGFTAFLDDGYDMRCLHAPYLHLVLWYLFLEAFQLGFHTVVKFETFAQIEMVSALPLPLTLLSLI